MGEVQRRVVAEGRNRLLLLALRRTGRRRGFAGEEAAILDRLNSRHQEMLDKIASESLCKPVSGCAAASLDSEGLEIASGGNFHRIWFGQTISTQDKLFDLLLNLGKTA